MLKINKYSLGELQTNCYILYDVKTLDGVIIDPACNADYIIAKCKSYGINVKHIIFTHGHFDHFLAADEICEHYKTDLIINKEDVKLLTNPLYNLSLNFNRSEARLRSNNIISVEDESLSLIGHDFRFISTPGHTPGSMCIIAGDNMFTGDTLFYMSIGNAFPPLGDFDMEIDSIKSKLLTLDRDYICYPGHGNSTTLYFEKNNNPYLR